MKIKRSFYDWNNMDGSHGLQGSVVTSPGADRKVIVSKIIAKIFHDHPLIGWNPADIKIVSRIEEAKRSNPRSFAGTVRRNPAIKRFFYEWISDDGRHRLEGTVTTSPGAEDNVAVAKIIVKHFGEHPYFGWNPSKINMASHIADPRTSGSPSRRCNPTEKVLWGHKRDTEDWAEDIISTQPARFEAAKIWAAERGYHRFRVSTMDLSRPPDFAGTVRRNPTAGIKILEPVEKSIDQFGIRYAGRGRLPRSHAIGRSFHWLAFKDPGRDFITRVTIQGGGGYIDLDGAHGKGWWLSTVNRTKQIPPPVNLIDFIGNQVTVADSKRSNPRYEVKGSYQARGVKGQHFHSGLLTVDAPNKRLAERKARASGHYVFGHRFRPFRVREI